MILTACFLLFVCALGIYTYTLVYPKSKQSESQQAEQPEQSTTDYERPNVFYSKDIQIVSEPNYIVPPYRISEMTFLSIEFKQFILVNFAIGQDCVSISISDLEFISRIVEIQSDTEESSLSIKKSIENACLSHLQYKNILK